MRNFSSISNSAVVTYHINFDECNGTEVYPYHPSTSVPFTGSVIDVFLKRLAAAFETPLNQVKSAFTAVCCLGEDAHTQLCPSEEAIIRKLYEFWSTYIINDQDPCKSNCVVFNYTNLNTGAVVTWVYVVSQRGNSLSPYAQCVE